MQSDAASLTSRFLLPLAAQDGAFLGYLDLYQALTEDGDLYPESVTHLMGSLERYIQDQRIRHLTDHWGGLDKGTLAQAQQVSVPPAFMVRVSGVVAFHGLPRTVVFLYVHAYLLNALGINTSILAEMNKVIDELDPR